MFYEKKENDIMYDRNRLEMVALDDLVPQDHLLRKIDKAINLNFIHNLTRDLYSTNGRRCIDTVVLFKIVLLNFIYGNNSIRKTCEEAKVNMAYRWYLGLGITTPIPNYSTFSQNYIRKFGSSDIFEKIFNEILSRLISHKFVDTSVIFVDGTHIKANANKNKRTKVLIKETTSKYQKDLLDEINEFREINGRDKYPSDDDDNDGDGLFSIDDETGEIIEKEENDNITKTVSTTDPDSGMFVKGDHERQFAYVDQVACDKYGWILGFDVNPGNVHDSKAFLPFFENKLLKFNPKVICADAGYSNGLIAHFVQSHNCNLLVPYTRPKGRGAEFGKSSFDYYFEIDQYMCPNRKMLVPWNITKSGNIEYKIHKSDCGACKYTNNCIKNYAFKTITRHIYDDCMLIAKRYRLSDEGKIIYPQRKLTIERVFAEGKEHHGLRYTRFKSLKKNFNIRALLYACLNIKKLALLLYNKTNKYNLVNCGI